MRVLTAPVSPAPPNLYMCTCSPLANIVLHYKTKTNKLKKEYLIPYLGTKEVQMSSGAISRKQEAFRGMEGWSVVCPC